MRFVATVALAAALSAPALCGDTVITKTKHTDAGKVAGREQPAQDSTETTWFAKDRMRIEEGDTVTLHTPAGEEKLEILEVTYR